MSQDRSKEGPRFHARYGKLLGSLRVPPGKELVKFNGQPVLVSKAEPDEPKLGSLTERQLREIGQMALDERIGAGLVPYPATLQDFLRPDLRRLEMARSAPDFY